jgi:hypothetical protein
MRAILVCLLPAVLLAQSELATLTGNVGDPSGGALAGSSVQVTSRDTGRALTFLTNEAGRFVAASLPPGAYDVQISHPGFKSYVNTGVTLSVNQSANLAVVLDVGDAAERITVSANASLLETESAGRGALVDRRKIVELPLNGRDYNQLALLVPGVLPSTPRLQGIGFKGAFNVNGNRAFQNSFLLDGVDNTSYSNSYRGGNVQVVQPSIEALQEFKIQTSAYSAEFGRSAGAVVNAVIRSGGNDVHGSAYEFHRNRELDAANFFSNKSGAAKPFRLRNQFGGAVGGPLVRNRAFFFGDYEGLRDRAGRVWLSSVPQPAWKQGRFTVPIANPFNPADTGADFRQPATPDCDDGRGNCWVIPANLIDPVGRRILNVSPDPNTGVAGQLDNNFVSVPITSNRTDQFDTRADQYFGPRLSFFERYSFSDTNLFTPAPRPGLAEGSRNDTFGSALWRSQAIAAGATAVLSPAAVAELRFGYSRGNFYQAPVNAGSGCPGELIGLQGAPTEEDICGGLPVINLTGAVERRLGRTTSVPQFQTPRSWDYRGSVSLLRGTHTLKFGAEALRLSTGIRDVSALLGSFTFSGRFSAQNGNYQGAVADLLLGFPTRYQQDSNTVFHQFQNLYFGYAQDDWKATRSLSLSVGLRYEFATPPREANNQWANFDPATRSFILAGSGSLYEQALIHPDRNNFGPRVGFVYSPFRRTAVRGSYGVFYNHANRTGREGLLGFNLPFIVLGDANLTGSNNLKAADARLKLQTGIPAGFVDVRVVDPATVGRKAQDPNQRTPYVQQWNFGIQQEVSASLMFEIAYVGNRGLKLPVFRNLNQQPVVFSAAGAPSAGPRPYAAAGLNGDIQFLENSGISNYHSLQLRMEKRYSAGLSFLTSYTYGKALANSPDHLSTSSQGNGTDVGIFKEPQNGFDRRSEYGPAEFDVRQRFVASAVWEVPFGRDRRFGSSAARIADLLFGGWEIAPILTAQSGLALTVTQPQLLNLGGERRSRPNRIGNGSLPESQRTVDRYLDASAFSILQVNPALSGFVPFQAFGNSGVGILRGPGLANVDLNASKNFRITEKQSLQFRAEFFNLLNHANFGVPGVSLEAGFGQISQTSTEARIIQFAIKYRF